MLLLNRDDMMLKVALRWPTHTQIQITEYTKVKKTELSSDDGTVVRSAGRSRGEGVATAIEHSKVVPPHIIRYS